MPTQRFTRAPWFAAFTLVLFSLVFAAQARASSTQAQDDPDLRRAVELFDAQMYADAVPLLEKLAARYPSDGQVVARLGLAVFSSAVTVGDDARRKQERARGRAFLVRARELGVTNELIEGIINGVAPDGSLKGGAEASRERFSANREADAAMREGEGALTRGEYDAALKAYARASSLDPKIYEAPLFEGDVHLQRQRWDKAAEAYARAVQIDPDKETAYRYWGDALMRQARLDDARDKYVEAVIAAPYNRYVWQNGLFRWAQAKGIRLGHPKIDVQSSVSPMKDNKMTITLDPKSLEKSDDGRAAWMMYGISRAAWAANGYEKFKKEYPGEKAYRHSLREEAEALRVVVEAVRNQQKAGEVKKLSQDLSTLVQLEDAGLLEAYVLFARADEGIAQDYAGYRKANRDKLRRYLLEYVTSGKY